MTYSESPLPETRGTPRNPERERNPPEKKKPKGLMEQIKEAIKELKKAIDKAKSNTIR